MAQGREMSTGQPTLSIVPVGFNSEGQIGKTVAHLEAVTQHLSAEILVVDNASIDRTGEEAAGALTRGRLIRSEENLGFAGGANLGLAHASGEFVLIMNDDVMPEPEAIDEMISTLQSDRNIGLVGPRMIHPGGSAAPATRRHVPGLRDEWDRLKDRATRRKTRSTYPAGGQPAEVGLLICAFVMARTDVLKRLGGFSPLFFFYGEDIDLCRRIHANGLRTVTVPAAIAVHDQEVAPDRRKTGRDFMDRILTARDTYYRVWLSKPERVAVNLIRALGIGDQPHRLRFHLRKAINDGGSLSEYREPVFDTRQG